MTIRFLHKDWAVHLQNQTVRLRGFEIISSTYHPCGTGEVTALSAAQDFARQAHIQGNHMHTICPICFSERVATLGRARRIGGTVGLVGCGIGGAASVLSGARTGMFMGSVVGPPGTLAGGLVGVVVAACFGGTTGAIAGAQLGEVIDERILDNYQCCACGHVFSVRSPS